MKSTRQALGLGWILGMIQYGVCLAGGGALWYLVARATGFFGGDLLEQSSAFLLLLILIVAEAWWIHVPSRNEHVGDYVADFLSSAAIAGFGMAVVVFIGWALPR
jgi:hypothetical protein